MAGKVKLGAGLPTRRARVRGLMFAIHTRRRHRRLRTGLLICLLLVAGATVAPAMTVSAASTKPRARVGRVAPIGTFGVGQISETFIDPSRPTNPNGTFPGAPSRTLLTAIYYPTTGPPTDKPTLNAPFNTAHGPYPLILFSHGVTARGVFYAGVITKWASAGYVVVAPDYPLSNTNAPGGVDFGRGVADVKNQPADANFVISQVLKLDKTNKLVGGTVDQQHLGAAGHSLGAITTYGLVYSACCRDKRIDAAIEMSGIPGVVEPATNYFQGDNTPLLALHGNADPIVPYQADVNGFANAKPPKFFLTFLGAGHVSPFLGGTDVQAVVLQKATVDFWNRYLKSDAAALGQLKTDATVAGSTTFQDDPGTATGLRTKR
jgi:dienelactone hydrolase